MVLLVLLQGDLKQSAVAAKTLQETEVHETV